MDRQNPKPNGEARLYRQNHTQKHTNTHSQKEKKGKNIYIIAPKVHLLNMGWLIVYSGIPEMQGTSSWLQRFNLLLLRLLGEISLSFLCSHSSWESALDLALPLCVGRLRASVLCSEKTGIKEQLLQELLLTQARGREGYGMQVKPSGGRGQHDASPAWGMPCVLQGCCPWITWPWQWWAAQSPSRGGVDSDLCLHTGLFVAAAADLASHACLWHLRL